MTVRELATRFALLRGLPSPKLTTVPYAALWAAGLFSPLMRELRAIAEVIGRHVAEPAPVGA